MLKKVMLSSVCTTVQSASLHLSSTFVGKYYKMLFKIFLQWWVHFSLSLQWCWCSHGTMATVMLYHTLLLHTAVIPPMQDSSPVLIKYIWFQHTSFKFEGFYSFPHFQDFKLSWKCDFPHLQEVHYAKNLCIWGWNSEESTDTDHRSWVL